jgi:hypothetical protein
MPLRKKNKLPKEIPWRPNFNNPEQLPDTKVVRTGFLLNFVAIAAAVILASYLVILEYSISTLRSSGKDLQVQIDNSAAENRRHVTLSGQFNQLSRTMDQVVKFRHLPFELHQLILDLNALKPDEVIFQSITMQPTTVRQGRRETTRYQLSIQGRVTDLPDKPAAQTIADFQGDVVELNAVQKMFRESALQNFLRISGEDDFQFTIQIILNLE